jgi:hypothetical protein
MDFPGSQLAADDLADLRKRGISEEDAHVALLWRVTSLEDAN